MNRLSIISAFVAIASFLGAIPLASAGGFYVGASVGQGNIEFNSPDANNVNFDDIDFDDSDSAYKIFGGYQFLIFAAELAYVDFGEVDGRIDTGNLIESELGVSGFSGFAKAHYGIGPVSLFAKAGGFVWESEIEDFAEGEDDGFDLAYGVGAQVKLLGLSARAEYEFFNVGDFEDVSMISLGLAYHF